jgi:uncharacterized Zn finger protein
MKNVRERVEGFLNRLERAEAILLEGRVHRVEGLPYTYVVRGSDNYLVDLERETCTCPDHARGHTCKHLLAAVLLERAERKAAGRVLKEVA